MHKHFLPLLLAATLYCNAQESSPASVESSVFGLQTGLVGFWSQHELRLSNQFALRSEIGAELMTVTYSNDEDESILAPVISVEPKWYYNLEKRVNKGRNIKGNSGNYFSVKANYNPDWFTIGNSHGVKLNHLAILPKWGIRRVYGKHFTFETGIGIGPQFYVGSSNQWEKDTEVYVDALVRIGYTF